MKKVMSSVISILLCGLVLNVHGATVTSITHAPTSSLHNLTTSSKTLAIQSYELQEIRRNIDTHRITHVKYSQTYKGIPIWGSQIITHFPPTQPNNSLTAEKQKSFMSGTLYVNIDNDLHANPQEIFTAKRQQQAILRFKQNYSQKTAKSTFTEERIKPIIYVDDKNQSHYAFHVSFFTDDGRTGAHRPNAIIDAETFYTYREWDSIVNLIPISVKTVLAEGFGGNEKTGKIFYDGATQIPHHLGALVVKRALYDFKPKSLSFCSLQNEDAVVIDVQYDESPQFVCNQTVPSYDNLYWLFEETSNEMLDAVNGAYSPNMDALFIGTAIKKIYENVYNITLTNRKGIPIKIILKTHYGRNFENAFFDPETLAISLGDGGSTRYPLVSSDVIAHEIGHKITAQYRHTLPLMQTGAIDESFSDMSAKLIEYLIHGENNWGLAAEMMKISRNELKQYMEKVTCLFQQHGKYNDKTLSEIRFFKKKARRQ